MFTINLKVSPKENPDLVGEYLRNEFFLQDRSRYKLGCYSTFETRKGVKKLPGEEIDEYYTEDNIFYHVYEKEINGQKIIMKYYWDGDGTLEFYFEDNSSLCNYDCKKTYGWRYIK